MLSTSKPRFPKFLVDTLGSETGIAPQDREDKALFDILFEIDQNSEQLEGYRYAEAVYLKKDIKAMSTGELADFIKELHRITANSLMANRGGKQKSGELSLEETAIFQETGIPGVQFEQTPDYSKKNYDILKKQYSEAVANQYLTFCVTRQRMLKEKKDSEEVYTKKLCSSPHYPAYQRVVKPILSEKLPEQFQQFIRVLKDKIDSDKDPVECATFALHGLITGHFFPHGNRRTARIFMTFVLMSLGHPAIQIPANKRDEYYYAIEQATSDNLGPLLKVIREYAKIEHAPEELKPLFEDNDGKEPIIIQQVDSVHLHVHENCYRLYFQGEALRGLNHLLGLILLVEDNNQSTVELKSQFNSLLNQNETLRNHPLAKCATGVLDGDFYLRCAEKTKDTCKAASRYYCARAKRFYEIEKDLQRVAKATQFEVALIESPSVKPTAKAANKDESKEEKLRPIIHLAPFETARVSSEKLKEVGVYVPLPSFGAAVVVVRGCNGNVSITSVGMNMDLDFIKEEASKMEKPYTIDVITNKKEKESPLAISIIKYIATHLGTIKNTGKKPGVRTTEEETVLIRGTELKTPRKIDMNLLSPRNKPIRAQLAESFPYKDSILEDGTRDQQQRVYQTALKHAFTSAKTLMKSVVVYDDQWTGSYHEFGPKIAEQMKQAKTFANDDAKLIAFLGAELKNTDMAFVQHVANTLKNYWGLLSGNRWFATFNGEGQQIGRARFGQQEVSTVRATNKKANS